MLLWIHPVLEILVMAPAFYVLYMGWRRFTMAHMGRRGVVFAWKQHVKLGQVVIGLWLIGLLMGLGMAWHAWQVVFITEIHYQIALAMVPLMLFGQASGWIMDKRKAKRKVLPLAHGINNLALVALAMAQVASGARVLTTMVMP